MFNNLKLNKVVAIVLNFILVFELVGWSAIFNYQANQAKAASPYFEMFVNSEYFEVLNGSVGPAINFHGKNGFSGNINVEFTDLNMPEETSFVISSLDDHINWMDVPDDITLSQVSEIKKLNIPLGENEWNGFTPTVNIHANADQDYSFKIKATGGGYTQEKTIRLHYIYRPYDTPTTMIIPTQSDPQFTKHTVNAGSSSTYNLGVICNYSDTINVSKLLPPAEGLNGSLPSSVNITQDMSGNGNPFDYTISTTSSTPNGYYFVSVKSTQGLNGPDVIYTYRLKVNNSTSQQQVSDAQTSNNTSNGSGSSTSNGSSSTSSSGSSSSSSTSSSSTSTSSSSSPTSSKTSTSKQLSKAVQKEENYIAKIAEVSDDVGYLEDTTGELTITPESGLADTKIELKGKGYPKDTELKVLFNPFVRYVKDRTSASETPPFRLVGLIDWGIIKTDGNGEFSTYRVLDGTDVITQSLTGKNYIRVGEDKVFNGLMGNSEHPFNENIKKAFTITIPIENIADKQTESTAQIWTGKKTTDLTPSEKIAVANLTAGLTDENYNKPFMEERTPANQKVVTYKIEGNMGPDGKRCKMEIKPEDYADSSNPLKKLASKVFNFLPSARAEGEVTDVATQALEDCPKTVTLDKFWKSPIAQSYTYGKLNAEMDKKTLDKYMSTIMNIQSKINLIVDQNIKSNVDVKKLLAQILSDIKELENIQPGNKFLSPDGKEVDFVDFKNFFKNYTIAILGIANESPNDDLIKQINDKIQNESLYRNTSIPAIDKDKLKPIIDTKILELALDTDYYLNFQKQNACKYNLGADNISVALNSGNCEFTYVFSNAIKQATTKAEIDQILEQLKGYVYDSESWVTKKAMLAFYGLVKKNSLPDGYSDGVKKQFEDIAKYKELVESYDSVLSVLQLKDSIKKIGPDITDPKALVEYQDLVTYTDIKYRYLIHFDDPNNKVGVNVTKANAELYEKLINSRVYLPILINKDYNNPNLTLSQINPEDKTNKLSNKISIFKKVYASSTSGWNPTKAIKEIDEDIRRYQNSPDTNTYSQLDTDIKKYCKMGSSYNNDTFNTYMGQALYIQTIIIKRKGHSKIPQADIDTYTNNLRTYGVYNRVPDINKPFDNTNTTSQQTTTQTQPKPTTTPKPQAQEQEVADFYISLPLGTYAKVKDANGKYITLQENGNKFIYNNLSTSLLKVGYKIEIYDKEDKNKKTLTFTFKSGANKIFLDNTIKNWKNNNSSELECEEWLANEEMMDIYDGVFYEDINNYETVGSYGLNSNTSNTNNGLLGIGTAIAASVDDAQINSGIPKCLSNASRLMNSTINSLNAGSIANLNEHFREIFGEDYFGDLGTTLFYDIAPEWYKKAAAQGIKEGKCGYQTFENPDHPGQSISAVVLCDGAPRPGNSLGYGPYDSSAYNTQAKSNGLVKSAFAEETNTEKEYNYTNFIHLSSDKPIGFMVIDPTGRAVGWNPISQNEITQINNVNYSGIGSAKPEMLIRGLVEGDYNIRLIGLDEGPYKVNLAIATGDQVWTKTYQGMIKKNEIIDGKYNIGLDKASTLTISQRIFDNPYYKFGGLGLILLILAGGAYYYIHHHQIRFNLRNFS